jgi:hypothetical protein
VQQAYCCSCTHPILLQQLTAQWQLQVHKGDVASDACSTTLMFDKATLPTCRCLWVLLVRRVARRRCWSCCCHTLCHLGARRTPWLASKYSVLAANGQHDTREYAQAQRAPFMPQAYPHPGAAKKQLGTPAVLYGTCNCIVSAGFQGSSHITAYPMRCNHRPSPDTYHNIQCQYEPPASRVSTLPCIIPFHNCLLLTSAGWLKLCSRRVSLL